MQKRWDETIMKSLFRQRTIRKHCSGFGRPKRPGSALVSQLRQREDGDVVILVAVSMVVIMIILALVIDMGLAYLSTNFQQKVADAAVYSAGRLLPVDTGNTTKVNEIKDAAIHYASLNGFDDLTRDDVVLGTAMSGQYTDIRVTVSKNVAMNFARTFGVDSLDISRSAVAKLSPVISTSGVAPIGLTKDEMEARIASNNLKHVTLKYGVNSGSVAFFGALDLDGTSGGASDYRIWIAHGYPGEISVGDILVEEDGNMVGPTYQGFETRFSECTHFGALTGGPGCTADNFEPSCPRIVKVPIYSYGIDKKTIVVEGFAAFLLEYQTNDGYITGSFLNLVTDGSPSGANVSEGSETDFGLYNLMLAE
jgi:Flp pilus assembly protein TadG